MMKKAALALVLISLSTEQTMAEETHALALEVTEKTDMVEVQLRANSSRAQTVAYTLELSGRSTSRHRGKTSLLAETPTVLATVRTAKDEDWCAKLRVEEEGREPYEVLRGSC